MRISFLQKEILLFMFKERYWDDKDFLDDYIYKASYEKTIQNAKAYRFVVKTINLIRQKKEFNEKQQIPKNLYEKYRHSLKNLVEKGFLKFEKNFGYWLSYKGAHYVADELFYEIQQEKKKKEYIFQLVDSVFSKISKK